MGMLHPFKELGSLPDLSFTALASLKANPEAWAPTPTTCTQCGEAIEAPFFTRFSCACDPCRDKRVKSDQMEKVKEYWDYLCPAAFNDTDVNHPGFPKAVYAGLDGWMGQESLMLYGQTRTGKTRVAMLLLRRLLEAKIMVGCLWPEQLSAVKQSHETLELIHKWGRYDVLLMDDCLLNGAADDRVTSWLKNLVDYRMRHKRHHIITTQIGGDDYEEAAKKFSEGTKADSARIKALLARIREVTRTVPFVSAVPSADEQPF
jgi:DNA replication protein DnaC